MSYRVGQVNTVTPSVWQQTLRDIAHSVAVAQQLAFVANRIPPVVDTPPDSTDTHQMVRMAKFISSVSQSGKERPFASIAERIVELRAQDGNELENQEDSPYELLNLEKKESFNLFAKAIVKIAKAFQKI
jgi:hypothetical protein